MEVPVVNPISLGRAGVQPVQLGPGHLVVAVPVLASTSAEAYRQWCQVADRGADLVEWRLDPLLTSGEAERAFAVAPSWREQESRPVLVTVRTAAEGGAWTAVPGEYLDWVERAGTWADAVDIELATPAVGELVDRSHQQGARVVLSRHVLAGSVDPGELQATLEQMVTLGADVVKVAWQVQSQVDVDQILAAQRWAAETLPVPAVIIGMGPAGQATRRGQAARLSAFTFGVGAVESAPGQLSIAELRAADLALGDEGEPSRA